MLAPPRLSGGSAQPQAFLCVWNTSECVPNGRVGVRREGEGRESSLKEEAEQEQMEKHNFLQKKKKACLTFMPYLKICFPKAFEMEKVQTGFQFNHGTVKNPDRAHCGWCRKHSGIFAIFKCEQLKLL